MAYLNLSTNCIQNELSFTKKQTQKIKSGFPKTKKTKKSSYKSNFRHIS